MTSMLGCRAVITQTQETTSVMNPHQRNTVRIDGEPCTRFVQAWSGQYPFLGSRPGTTTRVRPQRSVTVTGNHPFALRTVTELLSERPGRTRQRKRWTRATRSLWCQESRGRYGWPLVMSTPTPPQLEHSECAAFVGNASVDHRPN